MNGGRESEERMLAVDGQPEELSWSGVLSQSEEESIWGKFVTALLCIRVLTIFCLCVYSCICTVFIVCGYIWLVQKCLINNMLKSE